MVELASTPTSISLKTYLSSIPLDSMTWGEAEELDRIVSAEVEEEWSAADARCAAEGHEPSTAADHWAYNGSVYCKRCGVSLEADDDEP